MIVLRLALQSLRNRWLTALLTVIAIAVSVMLLLGVEKVRDRRAAELRRHHLRHRPHRRRPQRQHPTLLLYSVFRIGNATNNITWASYQDIAARPEVAWIVPLSLGDSHRGFRVLGTTPDYFERYRYRQTQGLTFRAGKPFADLFDAVIGADVAAALGYKVGDPHRRLARARLGRLRRSTTTSRSASPASWRRPARRSTAPCMSAWKPSRRSTSTGRAAARVPGQSVSADEVRKMDLKPKAMTAALVGLSRRLATFRAAAGHQRVPRGAAVGDPAGRRAAGVVGPRRHGGDGAEGGLGHGGGDRPARHGDHDPDHAERAPPRDGDPALGRRAARAPFSAC